MPYDFNLVFLFSAANSRELIEYLNAPMELLAKNGKILDNVLETLNIQQHSLGILYVYIPKPGEINQKDGVVRSRKVQYHIDYGIE